MADLMLVAAVAGELSGGGCGGDRDGSDGGDSSDTGMAAVASAGRQRYAAAVADAAT